MSSSKNLYHPINSYQTRLIRLHDDNGVPNSDLICDLLTADILHPRFEGLGVRSGSNEGDSIVAYEALSYAWGSNDRTKTIKCNDIEFPITQNLWQALMALRLPQAFEPNVKQFRYLWVDAICINQNDNLERGEQVWNMLTIYGKAIRVIGWLGADHEDIEVMLNFAQLFGIGENFVPFSRRIDCGKVLKGLDDLYNRPWFSRIWVQQEIFASRDLILCCGSLQFKWSMLLSNPGLLAKIDNDLITTGKDEKFSFITKYKNKFKNPDLQGLPAEKDQAFAISTIAQLHRIQLQCFERFSEPNRKQPDFIETLLDTGFLNATDPRDYIYGIIGITGFPARAMTLREWRIARKSRLFIPIDYSINLASLLTAVTWVLLMKGGITILAKFKIFPVGNIRKAHKPLPSWVIDWHLAAQSFQRREYVNPSLSLLIENPWDIPCDDGKMGRDPNFKLVPCLPPPSHSSFCDDNADAALPLAKLILCGKVESQFYVKRRKIWHRQWRQDNVMWNLEEDIYETDIVVYMLNFVSVMHTPGRWISDKKNYIKQSRPYKSGELWLLRPMGRDEYMLVKCLTWDPIDDDGPYSHWMWNPKHSQESFFDKNPVPQYRRLSQDSSTQQIDSDTYDPSELAEADIRTFTII